MSLAQRLEDLVVVLGFDYKDLDSRIPYFLATDPWHKVGTAGEPAFGASWTNYNASYFMAFRKGLDGVVRLRGLLKGGVNGSSPFTLPVGYRPVQEESYIVFAAGGTAYITITTAGVVSINGQGSANVTNYVYFSGIEFDTDSVNTAMVGPKGDTGDPGPQGPAGDSVMVPMDIWHKVGTVGQPAFLSPWGNYVAGSQIAQFRKYPDGKVKLSGYVKGGTSSPSTPNIFTLPVGYRPIDQVAVFAYKTGGGCLLTVNPDGMVQVTPAPGAIVATDLISLDAMEFDTETVTEFAVGPQGPEGAQGPAAEPTTSVMDTWHKIGTVGQPAFGAGWSNLGGAEEVLAFRKAPDGKVALRGIVNGPAVTGGTSSTIFTLPVGYRPPKITRHVVFGVNGPESWRVNPSGIVEKYGFPGYAIVAQASDASDVEFDTESVTELLALKGDKGNPGSFIDAMTYFPSYDISEAVSGWGDAVTTGRPDNEAYLFTSVETDDQGQSPEGVQYVQTLIGLVDTKKVWRRIRVGSFTSTWQQIGNPAPTWINLAGLYFNSWTEYDTARYSKDSLGYVQLRGEIRAWTGGVTAADVGILALPVGFRPAIRTGCPVWSNDAAALSLYTTADGTMRISRAVAASVVVNIGSVSFPTQ